MPIANMQELSIHELYDAEHRSLEGQGEMVQAPSDQDLQSSIQQTKDTTRTWSRSLPISAWNLGERPTR